MRVKIRLFRLSDLLHLKVQKRHLAISPFFWRHFLLLGDMLGPWSLTAEVDGHPVASYGALEGGWTWALLEEGLGRHMIPITRSIKRLLSSHVQVVGPVYAHIDEDHPEAVRWARILGFEPFEGKTWRFG